MKTLYSTTAVSSGEGRNGHVRSDDGILDLDLAMPTALGGNGGKTNPEQLFAAGYSACFHSALKLMAGRDKVALAGSTVTAEVQLLQKEDKGFALGVTLHIHLPGVEQSVAEALAAKAHTVCPYSNAVRGNIEVVLDVA